MNKRYQPLELTKSKPQKLANMLFTQWLILTYMYQYTSIRVKSLSLKTSQSQPLSLNLQCENVLTMSRREYTHFL